MAILLSFDVVGTPSKTSSAESAVNIVRFKLEYIPARESDKGLEFRNERYLFDVNENKKVRERQRRSDKIRLNSIEQARYK